MGSGGSIEMKIPVSDGVESGKRENKFIKKHSSQPQNLITGAKSRQRAGVRASQSLYSVDLSGSPSNLELESARRENELKLTKEQDSQALMRKVKKLEDENSRLRAELQALSRSCQKLRLERQAATETCDDANQRAIALDQDREKIQRQFKIFRETKESEIQDMLQSKRDLESKLHRLQAHGFATSNDFEFGHNVGVTKTRAIVPNSPTPSNQWWDRPDSDTTSLFGSFTQIRNAPAPESNASITELKNLQETIPQAPRNDWNAGTSNLDYLENAAISLDYSEPEDVESCQLRCFITGTSDCTAVVENFIKLEQVENLKEACLNNNCLLSIVTLTEPCQDEYPVKEIVKHAVEISDLVLFFIGQDESDLIDVTYNTLQSNTGIESLSSVYFLFNDEGMANSQYSYIRKDVENSKKCRRYSSREQAIELSVKELQKIVKAEFGVAIDHCSEEGEVSCVDDIAIDNRYEEEQRDIGSIHNETEPVGLDSYFSRLNEFVSSPSPTPPLLISGERGSGKTTLIKFWLDRLRKESHHFLVFHHFVTSSDSAAADPVFMMRRLLHQISRHLPSYLLPPPFVLSTYDPASLPKYVTEWLDRLSSISRKQIVLVIDSIDRVVDVDKHFKFLLDPLPVSVRVVVSVGGSCPVSWNQWPSLRFKPLSLQHIGSICTKMGSKSSFYRQYRDKIVENCHSDRVLPLQILLLTKICMADFIGDRTSLMRDTLKCHSCDEVYEEILHFIEHICDEMGCHNCVISIFQFIHVSRNGLSEDEILNILTDLESQNWLRIRHLLTYFCIIVERAGLLKFSNSTVSNIVAARYITEKISKSKCNMLVKLFSKVYSPRYPRSAEMLPWLFYKLKRKTELQNCLLHPIMFHHLYSAGKASEIIQYWRWITLEKDAIVEYYQKLMMDIRDTSALKKGNVLMNANSHFSDLMISHVYESVGRFFRDLNVLDAAVNCIERSMEIRENELDPDHHLVADCLHYLGSVYIRWKKYADAEPLLKHALQLVEDVVGLEHPRVIQELQSMCFVARKLEHHEDADLITRKIMSLQEQYGGIHLSMSRFLRLKKQQTKLEELAKEEDSIAVANAMNNLGVYCLAQKKLKSASSLFDKSLALKRKLLGEHHAEVAQCLHNLAAVYSEQKQYKKAMEHMKKSLEIRKIVFGMHNPSVITTAKNIAVLAKKSKDFQQARAVYLDLLNLSRDIHGADSVAAATDMVNLAVVESQLGRHDAALPLYEEACEIFSARLGPMCKEVGDTYHNMAILRFNKKEYDSAAELYKKSLAIRDHHKFKSEE